MNAPLSLFLTQFASSSSPVAFIPEAPMPALLAEDDVELPDEPIELPNEEVGQLMEAHEAELASLRAAHEAALESRLAQARAQWASEEGERLAQTIDGALSNLRTFLADRTVAALRPLLHQALLDRVKGELVETLDKLLANSNEAGLCFRGPQDLRDAVRAARPDAAIDWIVSDGVDVTLFTNATRVETRLADAFARITVLEG